MSSARPIIEFDHNAPRFYGDVDDGTDTRVWPPMLNIHKQIQANGGIAYSESYGGFWIVNRHEYVKSILVDDGKTFSNARFDNAGGMFIPPIAQSFPGVPALLPGEADPPLNLHARIATLPVFRPHVIERARAQVQAAIDHAIEEAIKHGECDVVMDLGAIPAMSFIIPYLGFPESERLRFKKAMRGAIGPVRDEAAERARIEMGGMIMELVSERRKNPVDDVTSHLANFEKHRFTDAEIITMLSTLLIGGIETTSGSVSSTLLYLHHHRAMRAQLVADPQRFVAASAEFLRYITPTLHTARTVMRDVRIGDYNFKAGERILLGLQAANHDGERYENPDAVVLDRQVTDSVVFGLGPHACIGRALAKMQFELIVSTVLRRMPDFSIDPAASLRYPHRAVINGWLTMPLKVN